MISLRILIILIVAVGIRAQTKPRTGANPSSNAEPKKLVCFYHSWNAGRKGIAKFTPLNINPHLCTHIIYANGEVDNEKGIRPQNPVLDIDQNGLTLFTGLRRYNKKLKILMGVGGQFARSARFSAMVSDEKRRKAFSKHAIEFARHYNFDGINLNWQFPTLFEKSKPTDKENYLLLTKEMRKEIEIEAAQTGKPKLLLTMNIPGIVDYIDRGYDIPKLNALLDWIHLLTYDFHTAFETYVSHHTPLYTSPEYPEHTLDTRLTVNYTINYLLRLGADNEKLILGLPSYGRAYTLFNPDLTELGAPADGQGDQAEYTIEKGIVSYFEICDKVKKSKGWTIQQENKDSMGPYAYRGNQWISYDDPDMIRVKTKYAMDHQLGGVLFMSMDMDDFRGTCFNRSYPLVEAARETLMTYEIQSKAGPKPLSSSELAIRLHNIMTTPEPPPTPDPEEDPTVTKARITRLIQDMLQDIKNISGENAANIIATKFSSTLSKPPTNKPNEHPSPSITALHHEGRPSPPKGTEEGSAPTSISLPFPEYIKIEDIENSFVPVAPDAASSTSTDKHTTGNGSPGDPSKPAPPRVIYMIYPPYPTNGQKGEPKVPVNKLPPEYLGQKPSMAPEANSIEDTSANKSNDDKVKIKIVYQGENQEISISIK